MSRKVIFETTDPGGRTIRLHAETLSHIQGKHPELKGVQEIKGTIDQPDIITEISDRTSLAYTKISRLDLHLNVYAKMDDTYSKGSVRSAFLARKPPKGEVIWYRKG